MNPFQGRAMGARQAGPQFPQRRALRRKKGGKIPGYFLGGFFGGSPATTSSSSESDTNFQVTDPNYTDLQASVLKRGKTLSEAPYEAYTGQGVAPLTADQNTAFGDIRANQGNYSPFFNQAAGSVGRIGDLDPAAAGLPYVGEAAGMTTGSGAASPFINSASKTFPGQVDQYMSPYTDKVVNRIADLGNRNLMENVLPGVNDTFTGGNAAQFGRERHADVTGRAIRDNQESILGEQAKALESGYSTAGNLFNSDANRAAGLAGVTGNLAQGDIAQRAGLGTTAANITNQGITGGAAAAGAATGVGLANQAAGLTDANALTASGAQQQTQAQNEENWKYNQFAEKRGDPYAKASFGQGISQGWTLPTKTHSTSSSTTTSQAAQGSPFGQIMGAVLGGVGALGGVPGISSLGSLFGGGMAAAGTPGSSYYGPVNNGNYAAGGMVPAISAMRKSFAPPQPPQGQIPGAMPTGMPGMPPMPTLAPQRPMGQPNGQPASPFAEGGAVGYAEGGQTNYLDDPGPDRRTADMYWRDSWDRPKARRDLNDAIIRGETGYADGGGVGYEVGGKIRQKAIPNPPQRPSLEQQLDAFGQEISTSAPRYRGHESPNPFNPDPNPVRRYAEGGNVWPDRLYGQGALSDEERAFISGSNGLLPNRLYGQGALSDEERSHLSRPPSDGSSLLELLRLITGGR